MSSDQIQVAMRFQVVPNDGPWETKDGKVCREDVLKKLRNWFKSEPDEYFTETDWEYDYKSNNNWTCSVINDKVFLDFIFKDEISDGEFDLDISQTQFESMAISFAVMFLFDNMENKQLRQSYPKIVGEKLKILNFYNGGCSGISEVE